MFAFFDWIGGLVARLMQPIIWFMKKWIGGVIVGSIIGAFIEVGVLGSDTMVIGLAFAFAGAILNVVLSIRKYPN